MDRRTNLRLAFLSLLVASVPGCQEKPAPSGSESLPSHESAASATAPMQHQEPAAATTEVRVRKIVAEQLGIPIDTVQLKSRFVDDLGADSLDAVELCMAVEEEFKLDIPDEDAEKITTVASAVDYVQQRQAK